MTLRNLMHNECRPQNHDVSSPTYSFVLPIYNEEETLGELCRRMCTLLHRLDGPSEVLLVNDGSQDASYSLMVEMHRRDARFKVIDLSRNFGHQVAITAGMDLIGRLRKVQAHGLTFPLLADADHEVAEKYGVWQEKSRYGRTYMGIVRTTYLIGPDGKVVERWDNVKVDGHVDAVAAAITPARA